MVSIEAAKYGGNGFVKGYMKYLFLGLTILSPLPILSVDYPPLTDYPNHLLVVEVLKQYNNTASIFSQYLLRQFILTPGYSLHFLIMWSLSQFLSILTVGKIILFVSVILLPISVWALMGSSRHSNESCVLLSFFLLYIWPFNMGFLGYCLSLVFYCINLRYWLAHESNLSVLKWIILMLLSVAVLLFHIIGWSVFAWTIFLFSMLRCKKLRELFKRASFLIPSLLLFIIFMVQHASPGDRLDIIDLNPIHKIREFIAFTFYSFSIEEVYLASAFLLMLGIILVISIVKLFKNGDLKQHRHFLYLFFSLIGLFILIPINFFGVWTAARLCPFIITAGLCTCVSIDFLTSKKVIFLGIVSIIIISLLTTTFQYRKLDKDLSSLISGLMKIPNNKKILPIIIDCNGNAAHISPFLNAWAYYHIMKGGIGPYFFAYPYLKKDISPIRYRSSAGLPSLGLFEAAKYDFNSTPDEDIVKYEYLVIYGTSSSLFDYIDTKKKEGMLKAIHEDKQTKILKVLHD